MTGVGAGLGLAGEGEGLQGRDGRAGQGSAGQVLHQGANPDAGCQGGVGFRQESQEARQAFGVGLDQDLGLLETPMIEQIGEIGRPATSTGRRLGPFRQFSRRQGALEAKGA